MSVDLPGPGITVSMRAVRDDPSNPYKDAEDFLKAWETICADPAWPSWYEAHAEDLKPGPASNYLIVEARDKRAVRRQKSGVLSVRVPLTEFDQASDKVLFWQTMIREVLTIRAGMSPNIPDPPS